MTKKRSFIFIVPLVFAISILQCSSQTTDISGTYVNISNSSEYCELKEDGTFYIREGGLGFSGTYEVENDIITFILPSGLSARGRVEGDVIHDEDGKSWKKQ